MPPPAKTNLNTNKTILTTQQQHLQTILELKKQVDQLRLGKEVAESKVKPSYFPWFLYSFTYILYGFMYIYR